jgi:hypothetical protein
VTTPSEAALAKSVHGLDTSRRVGWAKYFDMKEAASGLAAVAYDCMVAELFLALRIQHHDRLRSDDPLVIDAVALIAAAEAFPDGRKLVERLKKQL